MQQEHGCKSADGELVVLDKGGKRITGAAIESPRKMNQKGLEGMDSNRLGSRKRISDCRLGEDGHVEDWERGIKKEVEQAGVLLSIEKPRHSQVTH